MLDAYIVSVFKVWINALLHVLYDCILFGLAQKISQDMHYMLPFVKLQKWIWSTVLIVPCKHPIIYHKLGPARENNKLVCSQWSYLIHRDNISRSFVFMFLFSFSFSEFYESLLTLYVPSGARLFFIPILQLSFFFTFFL